MWHHKATKLHPSSFFPPSIRIKLCEAHFKKQLKKAGIASATHYSCVIVMQNQ
jgi:hypothetical protein